MTALKPDAFRQIWTVGIEGMKFGGVGLAATAVHVAMFSATIEIWQVAPMKANLIAFGIAFWVSLFGHFYWTFNSDGEARRGLRGASIRFLIVALVGLGLNSLVVFCVESVFELSYIYATVGMIFLVPGVMFLLSRYWAFNGFGGR